MAEAEEMQVLVVGATGATGSLLVRELLARGQRVRALVRSPDRLREAVGEHAALAIIRATALDLDEAELRGQVAGCAAVACCLGHNLTWRGVFGQPRRLVSGTVLRLCAALAATPSLRPRKFVLMNSAGVRDPGLSEPVSSAHAAVVGILRYLLPPHADNEAAAEALRDLPPVEDSGLEWAVVRPDNLTLENEVTPYTVHASPTRSAIFNAGQTSRINVAHFMADLISRPDVWAQWKGRMPVLYNAPRPAQD